VLGQHLADALERRVAGGVAVYLVQLVQVVGVGEHERERAAGGASLAELFVEDARVAEARHEVASGELAQPVDELAVAARVEAHERADDRERHEADCRRRRHRLRRRHSRSEHDGGDVERGREDARERAQDFVADERDEAERDVEEGPEPEARGLHEDEGDEDAGIEERGKRKDQPPGGQGRRRHLSHRRALMRFAPPPFEGASGRWRHVDPDAKRGEPV
jgi:hypothetical protein